MGMVSLAAVVQRQIDSVKRAKAEQAKAARRVAGRMLTAAKLRFRVGRKVKTPQDKVASVVEVFRINGEVQVKVQRDAVLNIGNVCFTVPNVNETWTAESLEVVK